MDNSNRTIKFRAWDKKEKEMSFFSLKNLWHPSLSSEAATYGWGSFNPNKKILFVDENNHPGHIDIDDYEIMQFTGLKDAKGKEIFEGDILNNGDYNYEVFFLKEYAGFYIKKGRETIQLRKDLIENDFEVIGNIYKHGNLLKNN